MREARHSVQVATHGSIEMSHDEGTHSSTSLAPYIFREMRKLGKVAADASTELREEETAIREQSTPACRLAQKRRARYTTQTGGVYVTDEMAVLQIDDAGVLALTAPDKRGEEEVTDRYERARD